MLEKKPVFRADHVGSLLRPQAVKDARKACLEEGSIDAATLSQVEDDAIRQAVVTVSYTHLTLPTICSV